MTCYQIRSQSHLHFLPLKTDSQTKLLLLQIAWNLFVLNCTHVSIEQLSKIFTVRKQIITFVTQASSIHQKFYNMYFILNFLSDQICWKEIINDMANLKHLQWNLCTIWQTQLTFLCPYNIVPWGIYTEGWGILVSGANHRPALAVQLCSNMWQASTGLHCLTLEIQQ